MNTPRLRYRMILALALAGGTGGLQAALEFEAREITIKPKVGETTITGEFVYKNTGTEPITVVDIHSGCGCTVPAAPKEAVAPGASGRLPVVYTPGGRQGRQMQTITLRTSDQKEHSLRMVVDLPVRIAFEPRLILLQKGSRDAKAATVTFDRDGETTLLEVTSLNPAFELVGEPRIQEQRLALEVRYVGAADAVERGAVQLRTRDQSGAEHTDLLYLRHAP